MSLGLVGRKVGMTRIFTEDGVSIPVTVLDVSNNRVTQIKTVARELLAPGGRLVVEGHGRGPSVGARPSVGRDLAGVVFVRGPMYRV